MREKFNFSRLFLSNVNKKFFSFVYDPAQSPQMLQETKQQIREKSCDLINSFFSSLQKALVSVFVLTSIETSL